MAEAKPPRQVKLFVAALHRDAALEASVVHALEEKFGSVDFSSPAVPFDATDYYDAEMGSELARTIISFAELCSPSLLPAAKQFTNSVEDRFRSDNRRRANLDVGYLDTHKIVLASCKAGGQKIFLDDGVYADMVARYAKGRFEPFPWSFADFQDGRYDRGFLRIRELYKETLRKT